MLPWKDLEWVMYMSGQGCYNKTPMIQEPPLSIKIAETKCNRGYNKHTVIIWFCVWGTYLLWYLEGGCLFISWETVDCVKQSFYVSLKRIKKLEYELILPGSFLTRIISWAIIRQDHLFKGTVLLYRLRCRPLFW